MAKGPALLILPALMAVRAFAGPTTTAPAPDYAQIGVPDQSAGRAAIEQVREAGLSGAYYIEFVLSIIPRRGDERSIRGTLWGERNELGPVLRIVLDPGGADERRWLIQGGPQPSAWRCARGGPVGPAGFLEPLWDGSEATAFDVEMPFLYWPDETLVGVNRVAGRPADDFLFRPPADFSAQHPDIAGVRAYVDTQYHFLPLTELMGANGLPLKTWTLVDVKKVAEAWIPKEFDVRNEATRDKTRLDVTGAAVNLSPPPSVFDPARLADDISPPAPPQYVDFGD
jgi:hypothetical protein